MTPADHANTVRVLRKMAYDLCGDDNGTTHPACREIFDSVAKVDALVAQAETAEAAQFELRAEWKRAEAAEARVTELERIHEMRRVEGKRILDERNALHARVTELETALRDTAEQLGVWLAYVEAHTNEQTSYTREVLSAARAALAADHTQEQPPKPTLPLFDSGRALDMVATAARWAAAVEAAEAEAAHQRILRQDAEAERDAANRALNKAQEFLAESEVARETAVRQRDHARKVADQRLTEGVRIRAERDHARDALDAIERELGTVPLDQLSLDAELAVSKAWAMAREKRPDPELIPAPIARAALGEDTVVSYEFDGEGRAYSRHANGEVMPTGYVARSFAGKSDVTPQRFNEIRGAALGDKP